MARAAGAFPPGRRALRHALAALALAAVLGLTLPTPLAAAELTLHRILETGRPFDPAATTPEPLPDGEVEWREQAWRVEGVTALRIEAQDPEPAAALRLRPLPGTPRELELRVVLLSRPEPLDQRYFPDSEHLVEGRRERLLLYRAMDGIGSELQGEPGRVTRIVVQDDHLSELRLRREGETLVVAMVSPERGGHPFGGARPWYTGRPLTYLNYNLLGGGWADVSFLDVGFGNNALAELWLFRFLALKVEGWSSKDGQDTLALGRLVARQQLTRGEALALWLEGGAAAWQRTRNGKATEAAPTLTWSFGTTLHYRAGPWGAAAHLATVNGPLALELAGGWQFTHPVGLFLAWHGFDGDSAIAAGLAIDF